MSREIAGMILGIVFCFLSGAFDVTVGHITQSLDPMLLGLYCFLSSALLFGFAKLFNDSRQRLHQMVKTHWDFIILLNISVVMTWVGLFYALKFLEPAVVGVVSVAVGPALTLIISLFIGSDHKVTSYDKAISWLVLLVVFIMLGNSFYGHSGVTVINASDRVLGIISILICAIGTVSYTLISKSLGNKGWLSTEMLAVRNILMVLVSFAIIYTNHIPLTIEHDLVIPMIVLVVLGHIVPIYLIQKTILMISPLQVAIILLSLPVFTLLLEYLDDRISFSLPTIISIIIILILMSASLTIKFYQRRQE